MKKQLLLLTFAIITGIVCVFTTSATAQNLVPNPGFDTYTTCPSTSSQVTLTPPWFNPAGATGSPDYMNACFTGGQQGAPTNFYGYQVPYNPGGYYGLITYYNGVEVREYLSVQLTSPLVAGTVYNVGFHVSLSDNFMYATDHFGAYISNGPVNGPGTFGAMTAYTPQIDNPSGNVISDMINWTLVSGTYTAVGGENYITLGNFSDDANTQAPLVNPGNTLGWGYYYIDEVFVIPTIVTMNVTGDPNICSGDADTLYATGSSTYQWANSLNPGVILFNDSTFIVSPTVTTTYLVYGTSDTLSFTVNVASASSLNLGNDTAVCSGQNVSLNATTAGATAYLWQDNSTNSTYTVTAAGTYWVQVTTGCGIISDTMNVTYSPGTTVNAIPNITDCAGATISIPAFVSVPAGATFTWTNSNAAIGLAANGSGNIANFTATNTSGSAITSTITVTPSLGCSGTATTFTITINPIPVVTVNSPTICLGTTANLTAGGATTYSWSSGATSTGTTTADATPIATTTYTVTGTSVGCNNTAVSTVTVSANITVTVNSPTICTGQTASLTAGGGTNYTWSAGATSTGTTTAEVTPLVTSTYTVTGTTLGCSGTAVSTVTVNPLPNVAVTSSTICSGQTATLTASGATSYTWSAGATSTGATTATATPTTTTTYTVTGMSAVCSNTAIATVTVNALPTALISGGGSVCAGASVPPITIVLTGVGPWNITYNNGTNSTSITASTSTYTINNPPAGTYSITSVADVNCTGTASGSASVVINPLPTPLFTASPLTGCEPLCVNFNNTSTISSGSITNCSWTFSDGGNSSALNPNYCFNQSGLFSVTMTAISNANCSSIVTVPNMISVTPTPVANFTAPAVTSIFNSSVHFTDHSTNTTAWNWNFGDYSSSTNNTSNLQNPSHHYAQVGTYCVLLTATNGVCTDTSEVCVVIEPEFTFYVPNSFSPNEDGINDEFYGKGDNFNSYQMWIYDRWGNSVFYSDDINKHWDGRMNGNEVQQDVYVYMIKIVDFKKEQHSYIGNVTLEK